MGRFFRHIVLPAVAPALFFAIACTPVQVIGCRNRGLLALSLSLTSGLLALYTAINLVKVQARGDSKALWWFMSTLLLTIPVVALIILA